MKTSVDCARSIAATTSGSSLRPMWPAQGKRSTLGGASVSITTRLAASPRTMRPRAACAGPTSAASASSRLPSVADRPQTRQRGRQRPQARERELHLHAPLARQQLVPLVHDDAAQVREALAPVRPRQEEGQALRRGDQRRGQPLRLPGARRVRGVAGAHVHGPGGPQGGRGAGEREPGVAGERPQRRDPEHGQRRRLVGRPLAGRAAGAPARRRRSCPCRWGRAAARIRRGRRRSRPLPGMGTAASPGRRTSADPARSADRPGRRAAGTRTVRGRQGRGRWGRARARRRSAACGGQV